MTTPRFIVAGDVQLIAPNRPLSHSAAGASVTGTVAETTLGSVIVPGGTIGAAGIIRVRSLWSHPNNANSKTLRVKFGGTTYGLFIATTSVATRDDREIFNITAGTQKGMSTGGTGGWGTGSGSIVTSSVDTTQDVTILLTGQLANSGDTLTLEAYAVEVVTP